MATPPFWGGVLLSAWRAKAPPSMAASLVTLVAGIPVVYGVRHGFPLHLQQLDWLFFGVA